MHSIDSCCAKLPSVLQACFSLPAIWTRAAQRKFEFTPILETMYQPARQDYEQLSATPDQFDEFSEAVGLMQRTQPNYSADDLAQISVPVVDRAERA